MGGKDVFHNKQSQRCLFSDEKNANFWLETLHGLFVIFQLYQKYHIDKKGVNVDVMHVVSFIYLFSSPG